MIFRLSLILNAALCILFILCGLFILLIVPQSLPTESIVIFLINSLISFLSLVFCLVCYKLIKLNRDKIPFSRQLKNTGNTFFAFTILAALVFLFMASAVIVAMQDSEFQESKNLQVAFVLFVIFFLICGITSIVNLIHYRKLLRKNKVAINDQILDIGT